MPKSWLFFDDPEVSRKENGHVHRQGKVGKQPTVQQQTNKTLRSWSHADKLKRFFLQLVGDFGDA